MVKSEVVPAVNKVSKLIVRSLIALVVLVGLVEAGLWFFAPVEPHAGTKLNLSNKIRGFQEKVTFEMGPDQLRRLGWSGNRKEDGAIRVVCVGGTQTAALLQNVEDSWWGQLKLKLEETHPGQKFEFGALGMDSRGILYGAKWAQTYLSKWRPDIVIAQYGVEDVVLHPENYLYDDNKLAKLVVARDRPGLKGALCKVSQLCRRLSLKKSEARMKKYNREFLQENYYAYVVQNSRNQYTRLDLVYSLPRSPENDPLREYQDGLRGIVSAARDCGAKILLVGEPSLCSELSVESVRSLMMYPVRVDDKEKPLKRPRAGWVEEELIRYYRTAAAYADGVSVPFVNLHTQVPQDGAHFLNEMALTDQGAKKVAELLHPEVEKLLSK